MTKHTKKAWVLLGATLLAFTASPALAGPKAVVELFTSQGCSSCPPANQAVTELAERDDDVLALSYGVTYWDYLGWKDTFGDPAFTDRQRRYSKILSSGVYTPQIVLNGTTHSPRLRGRTLVKAKLENPAHFSLSPMGGGITMSGDLPDGAALAIVRYRPGTQSVAVKRGENHGRTLTLTNVVTDIDYKEWHGTPLRIDASTDMTAVLVHHPETGAIIAAETVSP